MAGLNYLTLADWRREVAALYGRIRVADEPLGAWEDFRIVRDMLFARHEQSPLHARQQASFTGLSYYPYEARLRVLGKVVAEVKQEAFVLELPVEGSFRFTRFARVHFSIEDRPAVLALYWVDGYGGGLFLPFRDASNGRGSYGGGRYLYDGIKGADLGAGKEQILLDFNFAYNPSCAYNDRWVCPLALPENWMEMELIAGEKAFCS